MAPGHCIVIFILAITTNNTEYEQLIFGGGEMCACVCICMHVSFDLFRRKWLRISENNRWY